MNKQPKMKQYRIGEYAGYMGVTPDLLKHYEQHGLLSSVAAENGYRYYPFNQSMFLLDCFRLRGYGFPLREMEAILRFDDIDTIKAKLTKQSEAIKKHILFEQAVVRENEKLVAWRSHLGNKSMIWHVEEKEEAFLFLPHSFKRDFLKDERIYQVLPGWMSNIPMVKPCMQRNTDESADLSDFYWGFYVSTAYAQECGIPINDMVRQIKSGRMLVMDYAINVQGGGEMPTETLHSLLKEKQLEADGPCYSVILMEIRNQSAPLQCGRILQPLR